MNAPNYKFHPSEKPSLNIVEAPLVIATNESLEGYGYLVDDPNGFEIEIVRWPAQGWRPVDEDSGNEGGSVEGEFKCQWRGDVLYGLNEAVGGDYVLGFSRDPQHAAAEGDPTTERKQVLLWHMNYHPDGGQMFFPIENKPFIVPVALPGDDIKPTDVIAFWSDGTKGIYIHPNIWHEGVFPASDRQSFRDIQGKVHARVSVDLGAEFGCYVAAPLMPQT